jgi:hypothetical protein
LLEAISLIKLIARDDLMVMFQELLVFLQHQKGDYLATVKYLEKIVSGGEAGSNLMQLMLFEAYLGLKTNGYASIKSMIENSDDRALEQAQMVLNVEKVSDAELKS